MMNIGVGIGIGTLVANPLGESGSPIAYAWASALAPSVSASSAISININAVAANVNAAALIPTISNAQNASIPEVSANADANAIIPSVSSIRNVSVSSVVASATGQSLIPVLSSDGGGATTYYLQTDGVDDKLVAPSMTFTKIVMDISVEHKTSVSQMYVDFRPGVGFTSFYRNTSNNDSFDSINSVKVDGVSKTTNTQFVPSNTRCLVEVEDSVGTASLTFFSHNGNSQYMKVKVYDIKIYNGATLQAHYDMSTQTVNDQSGNGRNATLTGGAWVAA